MFVSMVPNRSNGNSGKNKVEYRENMGEAGRGPSELFSAEVQKPGDGVKIYHEEDGKPVLTGEDRSLFAGWMGGGGEVPYGEVSERSVDVNVNGVNGEGFAIPSPSNREQGTVL